MAASLLPTVLDFPRRRGDTARADEPHGPRRGVGDPPDFVHRRLVDGQGTRPSVAAGPRRDRSRTRPRAGTRHCDRPPRPRHRSHRWPPPIPRAPAVPRSPSAPNRQARRRTCRPRHPRASAASGGHAPLSQTGTLSMARQRAPRRRCVRHASAADRTPAIRAAPVRAAAPSSSTPAAGRRDTARCARRACRRRRRSSGSRSRSYTDGSHASATCGATPRHSIGCRSGPNSIHRGTV